MYGWKHCLCFLTKAFGVYPDKKICFLARVASSPITCSRFRRPRLESVSNCWNGSIDRRGLLAMLVGHLVDVIRFCWHPRFIWFVDFITAQIDAAMATMQCLIAGMREASNAVMVTQEKTRCCSKAWLTTDLWPSKHTWQTSLKNQTKDIFARDNG